MMSRKIRRVPIDVQTLIRSLQNFRDSIQPHFRIEGLPPDATVIAVRTDESYLDRIYVYIHSETYEEVPESMAAPDDYLLITQWSCEAYASHQPRQEE